MSDSIFRTAEGQRLISLLNPMSMIGNLLARRELTWKFAKRDLAVKYRASYFGMLWTVFSPILLLIVYTLILSVILGLKWQADRPGNHGDFAIKMFIGMLIFNVFSEVLNRSSTLVISHPSYVKKVVFPLEVLVPSVLISSLISMLVGLLVWLVASFFMIGWPTWMALLFPIVILPICLLTLGLGWFIASLGVFIRDVSQIVMVLTQILFLCTPIFYPIELVEQKVMEHKVPAFILTMIELNPLTPAIENARAVMICGWDRLPDWMGWGVSLIVSTIVALLGYAFFLKSRRAFGDVI
ncbi:MAG: ABC transporter permease [Planctomycetota bacterium]|nr:MAG: ABC transporter permease [Planctomycetota bacterium]